jgi:hypothetical protein
VRRGKGEENLKEEALTVKVFFLYEYLCSEARKKRAFSAATMHQENKTNTNTMP